jgi:hypothetical protein
MPCLVISDAGGAADGGESGIGVADRHDQQAERRFLTQLDPYRRTAGLDGGEVPAALVEPGTEGDDSRDTGTDEPDSAQRVPGLRFGRDGADGAQGYPDVLVECVRPAGPAAPPRACGSAEDDAVGAEFGS